MQRVSKKPFKLKTQFYDDSDPTARTSIHEIMRLRKGINIFSDLPASKYPRDRKTKEVIGIRLKYPIGTTAGTAAAEPEPIATPIAAKEIAAELIEENDELPDDILESSSMPVRGPGRPKKPIDAVQVLHEELHRSTLANSRIADSYEALLPLAEKNKTKAKIPPWLKKNIWRKQYSVDIQSALCPVCSLSTITSESFSAGHIVPESKGGSITIDNMMAICEPCNSQMGIHHLYWFAWRYYSHALWPFPSV